MYYLHVHLNTHHIWPQASEVAPFSCRNWFGSFLCNILNVPTSTMTIKIWSLFWQRTLACGHKCYRCTMADLWLVNQRLAFAGHFKWLISLRFLQASSYGEDDLLKFQVSISVVARARWAGLSISQTADLLKFSPHHNHLQAFQRTVSKRENIQSAAVV